MEEIKKMRPREYIKIRGANEHNLKNIDLDIPRNEMVVLTGMSGSGKSLHDALPILRRASVGIWSLCPPTPECFWDRWRNLMWSGSRGFPLPSP